MGNVRPKKGKCPKCGSKDLDYESLELEGEVVYYPFTCCGCSFEGKEWYELSYSGMTDNDGNKITIPLKWKG